MINSRVAFITYSLSGGGAEKNIILLRNYLKTVGIQADIILFKNVNDYKDEYPETNDIIALTNFKNKIPFLYVPFIVLLGIIRLFILMRRNRYTVLFGLPHYLPYYISVVLSKLFNVKSVLIVVNNIPLELEQLSRVSKTIHAFLLKKMFRWCDYIICISHGLSSSLINGFCVRKDKISVIPHGFELPHIAIQMKKTLADEYISLFEKNEVIVTAGRLENQKNHSALITLFKAMKEFKNTDTLKLCILGKGSLLSSLQRKVRELKLQNDVYFLGHESRNIYRYFYRAKLFILSSEYEGFGNVIIEALACSLPIVSSDCHYGPREILTDANNYPMKKISKLEFCKYGVLIPIFSDKKTILKTVAHSINIFLHDIKKLNMYKKKSQEVVKDYSLEKVGEQYVRMIRKLV